MLFAACYAGVGQPRSNGSPGRRAALGIQILELCVDVVTLDCRHTKKSDLWTQSRANLEEAIEAEKENTDHNWDSDLLTHEQRLEQRLNKLKLDMFIMGSDGACQFRSVSYGLYGTEAYHKAIRRKAVQYLREHRSDFEAFLGDDFNHWLKEMSQNETWGDELTLVSHRPCTA